MHAANWPMQQTREVPLQVPARTQGEGRQLEPFGSRATRSQHRAATQRRRSSLAKNASLVAMHSEQNIRPITAARIPVADLEIGCDIEATNTKSLTDCTIPLVQYITIITKNKNPDRAIPDGTIADGCSRLWMLGRVLWIHRGGDICQSR